MNKLSKSLDPQSLSARGGFNSFPEAFGNVDAMKHAELTPESAKKQAEEYKKTVLDSPDKYQADFIHPYGGISTKAMVNTPKQNYLLKHYNEEQRGNGWNELTNQALFYAAGIGHLHQSVHIAHHDVGDGKLEPFVGIALSPGHKTGWELTLEDMDKLKSEHSKDIQKIMLMDFVTGNEDRHDKNLMFNENTLQPLAIDHAFAQEYRDPKRLGQFIQNWKEIINEKDWPDTLNWWKAVSGRVRDEFERQLGAVKNPVLKDHYQTNFNTRADWLDKKSKEKIPSKSYSRPWPEWQDETVKSTRLWPKPEPKEVPQKGSMEDWQIK